MGRSQVNMYTCKLRLLQYGLIDDVAIVDGMGSVKGAKSKASKDKEQASDDDDEPDEEDYSKKRTEYVSRRIREAKKSGQLDGLMAGAQNPIAAEARRELIKNFLKDINSYKKCVNCSGYVTTQNISNLRCFITNLIQCVELIQKGSLQQNFPQALG
jgi:DNA-directed RNA polymerase I subunit RPA1